ncbi:MAG: hypothetical protein GC146_06290 [Limimaricola sp.]|uniref:ureidoglycolate lyase n=1 Tax=Limimaricola sp. TaxID=2211665 RepID=UPI001DCD6492|nr:ureidoglycolate lyase [Limimaricola sp.]MBI1416817.1 hypothetical protein [Limimaricola sp.]
MMPLRVPLRPVDPAAFAPFGAIVQPPAALGQRAFFSDHLHQRAEGSAPVLHVNHVAPSVLPLEIKRLERHPVAAQVFIPLDVSRYVALVMPSDPSGAPDPTRALAMLMPGTLGIIYSPGVWHLGATVLDKVGSFAVLMWRGGREPDDEFRTIASCQVVAPAPGHVREHASTSGGAEA